METCFLLNQYNDGFYSLSNFKLKTFLKIIINPFPSYSLHKNKIAQYP